MDQQHKYNLRKRVTMTQRSQQYEGLLDLYSSEQNEVVSKEQPYNIESDTIQGLWSPDEHHQLIRRHAK